MIIAKGDIALPCSCWNTLRWRTGGWWMAGMLAALTAALRLVPALGLPSQAAWQVIVAYLGFSVLLWRWLPQHLPQRHFGLANGVTLSRALGVCLLAGLLGIDAAIALAWPVLVLALILLILDGADGWLARRLRCSSPFGARFDMETDALLVLVLALLVWQFDKAPVWIVLAGLWRYGFILAGHLHPPLAAPLPPSRRRQTVCVLQTLGLIICLCPLIPTAISVVLAALTLAILSGSFLIDTQRLLRNTGETLAQH